MTQKCNSYRFLKDRLEWINIYMCRFQTMHVYVNIRAWKCNNPISTPFNLNTTGLSLRSEDEERPAWVRVTTATTSSVLAFPAQCPAAEVHLISGSSQQHSNVAMNLIPMRKLWLRMLIKLLKVTWQFSRRTRI